MAFLLIRHKVEDYARWRPHFDAHAPAREAAGLTDLYLWHGADDENDVVLLFAGSVEDAVRFANSSDLREAMRRAGVVGEPEMQVMTGQELLQRRDSYTEVEAPA